MNYFLLFDLPEAFAIDLAELEKRYFAIQRLCHPDRLAGKPAGERDIAALKSMQANDGYKILKDPLRRVQHLLALQGVRVGTEQDTVKPTPELLMVIMEWREELESISTANAIAAFAEGIADESEKVTAAIADCCKKSDWKNAAQLVLRLGYLRKIEEDIALKQRAIRQV